jgi:TP901 family phage tail tape measure protein
MAVNVDVGTLTVKLQVQRDRFLANMDDVVGRVEGAQQGFAALGKASLALTGFAAAGALGITKLAQASGDLEQSLTATSKIMQGAEGRLKDLEQAAIDAGLATQFSPTEAAEGLQILGAAGQDADDAITSLSAVLNLATGSLGQLGLDGAATAVVGTLNAFSLSASKASLVGDKLQKVTQLSNFQARDFEAGLSKAAAAAGVYGQSLDDTLITLGALRDLNIDASSAGTGFREALRRIATDTRAQNELMSRGVEIYDKQTGKMRSLIDIMQDFGDATEGASEEQTNMAAQVIFGERGLSAFAAVAGKSREEIEEWRRALEGAEGTSAEFAKTVNQTFAGQSKLLEGALQTLAVVIGKPFKDALTPVVETIREAVEGLIGIVQRMSPEFKSFLATTGVGLVAVAGAVGTLGAGLAAMGLAVPVISGINVALAALNTTILGLIGTIGKILAPLAAAVAVGGAFAVIVEGIQQGNIKELIGATGEEGALGFGAKFVGASFKRGMADIGETMDLLGTKMGLLSEKSENSAEKVEKSGKDASEGMDELKFSADDLKGAFDGLADSMDAPDFSEIFADSFGEDFISPLVQRGMDKIDSLLAARLATIDLEADLQEDAARKIDVQMTEEAGRSIANTVMDFAQSVAQDLPLVSESIGAAKAGFQSGGPWGAVIAVILNLLTHTEGFTNLMDRANERLEGLVEVLGPIGALLDQLDEALSPIINIIQRVLLRLLQDVGKTLAPLFKIISNALGTLAEVLEPLIQGFEKLMDVLDFIADALGSSLGGLSDTLTGALSSFTDHITFWDDSVQDSQAHLSSFGKMIQDVTNIMAASVDELAESALAGLTEDQLLALSKVSDQLDEASRELLQREIESRLQAGQETVAALTLGALAQGPESAAALGFGLASARDELGLRALELAMGNVADEAEGAADALKGTTEELNSPQGFKMALREFQSIDPDEVFPDLPSPDDVEQQVEGAVDEPVSIFESAAERLTDAFDLVSSQMEMLDLSTVLDTVEQGAKPSPDKAPPPTVVQVGEVSANVSGFSEIMEVLEGLGDLAAWGDTVAEGGENAGAGSGGKTPVNAKSFLPQVSLGAFGGSL